MSATETITATTTKVTVSAAAAPAASTKLEQVQPEHKGFSLGPDPYPRPTFTDKHAERRWMLQHLAGAYRVFARNGYLEGSAGHISIRDPVDPSTFWINPLGKHFGLIKASDMVQVDDDSNVINIAANVLHVDGEEAPVQRPIKNISINLAGFKIHSELHKARPDVWAACHAHSIHGKAYSAFGRPLEMINQDACILYNAHAVYDTFGGIVLDANEGKHIAQALGAKNKGLILKNHGLLTVGETVDEAAYLFGLMERSCQIQLLADAAEAGGRHGAQCVVPDDIAQFTFENTAAPDILYQEFQPELEYEMHLDDSFLQ